MNTVTTVYFSLGADKNWKRGSQIWSYSWIFLVLLLLLYASSDNKTEIYSQKVL